MTDYARPILIHQPKRFHFGSGGGGLRHLAPRAPDRRSQL
jgi:hypothetical protein